MVPRLDYIRKLIRDLNWSGSELARRMDVSRAEANRFLNGKRKGGKKIINGLLQAFPEEKIETLFILPRVELKSNNSNDHETKEVHASQHLSKNTTMPDSTNGNLKPVRHPNSHQLACSISEEAGIIQIKDGKNITTLIVPIGPIEIRHTTKRPNDTS